MKTNKHLWYLCCLLALTVTACSSVPQRIGVLEEAQVAVNRVDADPMAGDVAGDELLKAKQSLRRAELAHANDGDIEQVRHDATMALRYAEIAEERLAEARAQAEIAQSEERRKEILLAAREHEAEQATAKARAREREADQARALAEERREEAEMSRLLAAEQARKADLRAQEAEQAKRLAAEQSSEAQQARLLAEQRSQEIAAREREAELARERAAAAEQESQDLQKALADLQAKQTKRGMVLTLGDVLFDTDKADLKPGAQITLDRLAAFLDDYPERHLLIEGHTDSRGPDEYNQSLSERRARSVRQALIDRGIESVRLRAVGLGEEYPVASNESSAGQQQNRRVEIVVSDDEGTFPAAAERTASL